MVSVAASGDVEKVRDGTVVRLRFEAADLKLNP
jgi:hypothetical protein